MRLHSLRRRPDLEALPEVDLSSKVMLFPPHIMEQVSVAAHVIIENNVVTKDTSAPQFSIYGQKLSNTELHYLVTMHRGSVMIENK